MSEDEGRMGPERSPIDEDYSRVEQDNYTRPLQTGRIFAKKSIFTESARIRNLQPAAPIFSGVSEFLTPEHFAA